MTHYLKPAIFILIASFSASPAYAAPVIILTTLLNPSVWAVTFIAPFLRKNIPLLSLVLAIAAFNLLFPDYEQQNYPAAYQNKTAIRQLLKEAGERNIPQSKMANMNLKEIIQAIKNEELRVFETPLQESIDHSHKNKDLHDPKLVNRNSLAIVNSNFSERCDFVGFGQSLSVRNNSCNKAYYSKTEEYLAKLHHPVKLKYSSHSWSELLDEHLRQLPKEQRGGFTSVKGQSVSELKDSYNLIFVNYNHHFYYINGLIFNTDLNIHTFSLLSDFTYIQEQIESAARNGKPTLFLLGLQHNLNYAYSIKSLIDTLYGNSEQGIYVTEFIYTQKPFVDMFTLPSYHNQGKNFNTVTLKAIIDTVGAQNVEQLFLRQNDNTRFLNRKEFIFNEYQKGHRKDGSARFSREISGYPVQQSDLVNGDYSSIINNITKGKYYYSDAYDFNSLQAANLMGYLVSKHGGIWLGTLDFRAPKHTMRSLNMLKIKENVSEANDRRQEEGVEPMSSTIPMSMYLQYYLYKLTLIPVILIAGFSNKLVGVIVMLSAASTITYLGLSRLVPRNLLDPIMTIALTFAAIHYYGLVDNISPDWIANGETWPAIGALLLVLPAICSKLTLRGILLGIGLAVFFHFSPILLFGTSLLSAVYVWAMSRLCSALLPRLPQKAYYLKTAKRARVTTPSFTYIANPLQMMFFKLFKAWRLGYPLIVRSSWADEDNAESLYGSHDSYVVQNRNELNIRLAGVNLKNQGGIIVQRFIANAEYYGVCHIPSMTPSGMDIELSSLHNGVTDSKGTVKAPEGTINEMSEKILQALNKLKLVDPVTVEFCIENGKLNLLQVKKMPFASADQSNHAKAVIQGMHLLPTEAGSDRLGASLAAQAIGGVLVGTQSFIPENDSASWLSRLSSLWPMPIIAKHMLSCRLKALESKVKELQTSTHLDSRERVKQATLLSQALTKTSGLVNSLLLSSRSKATTTLEFDADKYLSRFNTSKQAVLWNTSEPAINIENYIIAKHALTEVKEKLQALQRIVFAETVKDCKIIYSGAPRALPIGEYSFDDLIALQYHPSSCRYELNSKQTESEIPNDAKPWKEAKETEWHIVIAGEDVSKLPELFVARKKWVFVGFNSLSHIVMQAKVMGCEIVIAN